MEQKIQKQIVLLRYWGSHFKSPRHVETWKQSLTPFARRGWRCYLVLEHTPDDASWLDKLCVAGIEPVFIPRARRHFDPSCVWRVYKLCRRLGADIIHCDNIYTSPLIGAFLAGVPVCLWTKHNMNDEFEQCRPPTLRERVGISTRVSCVLTTKVIAVSRAVKDELVRMGISEKRILVLSNPKSTMPMVPYDRALTRTAMGYSESDVVAVTVGHAFPVKGWDMLLRAFKQVIDRVPRARLLVVGSTSAPTERECYAKLDQYVKEKRLTEVVKFVGHVHDVTKYLTAADFFVLPSRSEACANALVEAMEMELPCVATRVGNAEEIVRNGVNGFLVQRNDCKDLAEKLEVLMKNNTLRLSFTREAKVPKFIPTLSEYAEKTADIYEILLRKRGIEMQNVSM